jgi:hypothetical protein
LANRIRFFLLLLLRVTFFSSFLLRTELRGDLVLFFRWEYR